MVYKNTCICHWSCFFLNMPIYLYEYLKKANDSGFCSNCLWPCTDPKCIEILEVEHSSLYLSVSRNSTSAIQSFSAASTNVPLLWKATASLRQFLHAPVRENLLPGIADNLYFSWHHGTNTFMSAYSGSVIHTK